MSQRIIALNQRYLNDPRLPIGNDQKRDCDMLSYFCEMCARDRVLQVGLMPRVGVNNLPFDNHFVEITNQNMPIYDPAFDLDWAEVTDRRAHELLALARQNAQLYVQWSGGIDSTCIVVAILKNFPRADLEQVTICLTHDSVMEYSWFYEQHILPNFKTQDLNQHPLRFDRDQNAYLIDGQTADTLTMSMAPSLDVNMAVRHSDLLIKNWRTDPDALIKYLEKVTKSIAFADWYYEKISQNLESVSVPVETYFDFMWWAGFNYDWTLQTFCQWFYLQRAQGLSYQDFSKHYMPWYVNHEYQSWSLKNIGAWIKHGKTVASFKQDAKRYCYDLTKDHWNLVYKTKVSSRGRVWFQDTHQPFAVTDDFKVLNLTNDLAEILSLWHTHVNTGSNH